MDEDKIKEILDDRQQQVTQQQKQQKRTFWNNKKTVKGKALSAWLIVMIVIFMLFTFGIGIFLGKEVFVKNEEKTLTETTTTISDDTTKTIDSSAHSSYVEKGENQNIVYTPSTYDNNLGLEVNILEDKKSVRITLNLDSAGNYYAMNLGKDTFTKTLVLSQEVKQVFFGGFGQAVGEETLFFVMNDGTVEYIPIYDELKKENWVNLSDDEKMNSFGTINGVTNVEFLFNMQISGDTGYLSVGASRTDGTFYNLFEFLNN